MERLPLIAVGLDQAHRALIRADVKSFTEEAGFIGTTKLRNYATHSCVPFMGTLTYTNDTIAQNIAPAALLALHAYGQGG